MSRMEVYPEVEKKDSLVYQLSEDPELNMEMLNRIEVGSAQAEDSVAIKDESLNLMHNSSLIGESKMTKDTSKLLSAQKVYGGINSTEESKISTYRNKPPKTNSQMQVKIAPPSKLGTLNALALPQIKEFKTKERNTFDPTNRSKSTMKIGQTDRFVRAEHSLLSDFNRGSGRNSQMSRNVTYEHSKNDTLMANSRVSR